MCIVRPIYLLTYLLIYVSVLFYHGLRGSASPVLTATGLVNGRWRHGSLLTFWRFTNRIIIIINGKNWPVYNPV